MTFKNVICLVIGLIIGIRLTDVWNYVKIQKSQNNLSIGSAAPAPPVNGHVQSTKSSSEATHHHQVYAQQSHIAAEQDVDDDDDDDVAIDNVERNNNDRIVNYDDRSLAASYLFNNTRVLCWIMTTPANHLKRALHVRNTWGARCNKLLFMSTRTDHFMETIKLPVAEGRDYLWSKTRAAFKYVYDHHYDDADWFLKADDDSYFIMENLRAFLYQFSTDAPVYFGCKFHPFVKQGYMSGGAGYVLSKEALRRFAEIAYANTTICSQNKLSEDKEMGICLQNVGVIAGDSRDIEGHERFLPLSPIHLMPVDSSPWYASYLYYKRAENLQCCSSSVISFHYIKPKEFYTIDYMLYNLRVFGVGGKPDRLPNKLNTTELIVKWRHEVTDNIFRN